MAENTIPNCPYSCENQLPIASFDECAPEINSAQIAKVYVGKINQCFADWTDAAEWAGRISNTSTADTAIRKFHVIADKPKPTANVKDISLGRKLAGKKDHVLNLKIDETNATNHEMIREYECPHKVAIWYETLDGLLFGGNCGIEGSFGLDMIISGDANEIITFEGTFDWKAKFTEERIVSPMA